MGVKQQIRQTDEYQRIQQQAQEGGSQAAPRQVQQSSTTVGQSLGPVLNWEKSDVQFWTQVAQTLLLLLILRELRRS